jgi:hypothetical protein
LKKENTMTEPERFNIAWDYRKFDDIMAPDASGAWVKWDDIKQFIDELTKRVEALEYDTQRRAGDGDPRRGGKSPSGG